MDGERTVVLLIQVVQENHQWRVTVIDSDGITTFAAQTKADARAIVNRILAD